MLSFVEVLLCVVGAVVLLPGVVLLVEALAALAGVPGEAESGQAAGPRVAVLVPAHDESSGIVQTVRALIEQLPPNGRVVVVADNCTDDTAVLAAQAGATVLERHDPTRIGKGFAISFGLDHLAEAPPDIVILVDADCRISRGGLSTLARLATSTGRPVQAEYLLTVPANPGPMATVGALAILVRNRVRPRGLRRLGFPCQLTGSGMAFPWAVLRGAPATGANLVEDLVMGIELALQGHPPLLCPSVQVGSELPEGAAAGLRQRRRWEHGQLQTLVTYGPRLLAAGLARGRAGLLALGLDLMVPPLALLVMLEVGWLALTLGLALAGVVPFAPAALAAAGLALVGAAVAVAWAGFGRQIIRARQLVFVPLYLLWKIPLYLALAVRGGQKKWERTARKGESTEPPESTKPTDRAVG
ncbi:MAG TPA: glycosyltransferase [Polyangia bacterium]|nr:glycosyltransferase [Polyangia bacterium]